MAASVASFTAEPAAAIPAPVMAPARAWVVEIGRPIVVATKIVNPAPAATARRKGSAPATASGTRPFPENAARRRWARNTEATEPRKVVTVPQRIAPR